MKNDKLLERGFLGMGIFMIIGLILSGFDNILGQVIANTGILIMNVCLIIKLKEFGRTLE